MPRVRTVANDFFRRLALVNSDRGFTRGLQITPAAGENAQVMIENGAGSGVDVNIFGIRISVAAATFVEMNTNVTALPSPLNGLSLRNGAGASVAEVDTASVAGFPGGTNLFIQQIEANIPLDIAVVYPFVLTPGNSFAFRTGAADTQMWTSLFWIELPR